MIEIRGDLLWYFRFLLGIVFREEAMLIRVGFVIMWIWVLFLVVDVFDINERVSDVIVIRVVLVWEVF